MVKADVRRDYYADLGLTPSAETEDIKKQFRKLALKYHPDRNPGKEVEFISKFQAIQAANEILSDPQQRLRYDTDRLRAGYGKLYGPPPKANTPRKTPASPYASSYSPKPQPAKPAAFSTRPQSFHNGPSTGAQRYASYARAAPKQPWEKMQDEGQTRADAYRGFQEMKGNAPGGWSSFDPRTGYSGTAPRKGQTPRPKSAYEYFRESPKATSPEPTRSQSAKKKSGFAPRAAAGGDEPMATNTSAYTNVPRAERSQTPNSFFGAAPSPTARKAAAFGQKRAENSSTPDRERSSSRYASTGGERTFFSSTGLGRSASTRDSTESPKPRPRTNPPSPSPPETGRHRSASPKLKKDQNRNYSSTSSSEDEDDFFARKPKAVPKSRLHPHRKFNGFHAEQTANPTPESGSGPDNTGQTKDPFDTSAFFGDGSPLKSPKKTEYSTPNRSFKSSSHEQLRQPFTARSWEDADFFSFAQSDKEPKKRGRGRPSRQAPGTDRPTRNSQTTATTDPQPAHPESASSEKPAPFAQAKFSADAWSEKFSNMSWAIPTSDGSQQKQTSTSQRQKSPRKPRSGTISRPVPQPASVATEAEEARTTVNADNSPKSAKVDDVDVEAMDVDDTPPARSAEQTTEPANADKDDKKEMPPPKSRPSSAKAGPDESTKLFDLHDLGSTAPFTQNNSGGIDDLQDISASLPFESRAKYPRTSLRDIRPRKLKFPNPPKRPSQPPLVPVSAGSKEPGLPRAAWKRYAAEMSAYMHDWKAFNKRMVEYYNKHQEATETGMAPNWATAIGDSTQLKIDQPDDQDDDDDKELYGDARDYRMVAGSGKAGVRAYFFGLDDDIQAMKHLEVAREGHRECILEFDDVREWIRNGGKLI
ncbi:hypothetical protein BO70DRAFT_393252 [Aspergillus heteromorphus CBS 117.55]|uniref:J domain-containing protein n=1 Tax=Aspergillus heteromorphus CBS 117.55 TaxID=1448321 RepID=A0A317WW08_9EURO|nr:uncharacterized protein BO70DRAFT_393252 [Aspergillus heteromorphus CBS 117.55]PWY90061.1 hypothetical protein BO70DRAFT_393252 [Aspergillus heteromorphus CBS 117.55]